jgi:hypothetical protein
MILGPERAQLKRLYLPSIWALRPCMSDMFGLLEADVELVEVQVRRSYMLCKHKSSTVYAKHTNTNNLRSVTCKLVS